MPNSYEAVHITSVINSNESFNFVIDYSKNIDPDKASFWLFVSSLFATVIFITFITFYFSRCLGPLVAFCLTKFLRFLGSRDTITIGSISISFLAGKLMLRNFVYICDDYTFKINDGWIIFSYWRPVNTRRVDFKCETSRLHISLNGVQLTIFNRTQRYMEIARLFRLERIFGDIPKADPKKKQNKAEINKKAEANWDRIWAFIGVIRVDISSGRVVVGNRLLPYMFVFSFENLESKICLQPSNNDRAELRCDSATENVRASLIRHPEYSGPKVEDPPRTMGDGFAILQTAKLSIIYTQDILGFETTDRQSATERKPTWHSQWQLGQNTVFSYGPWVEAQRFRIYTFFYPPDFQKAAVTELPKRGDRRVPIVHDLQIMLLVEASIDLWFLRGDQLESIHTRCGPGSTLDVSIWWIVREQGFNFSTHLNLLNVESTTSLVVRRFLQVETFNMKIEIEYPREFNAKQTWDIHMRLSKAVLWLVWDHKRFFNDLISDWVGNDPPDLVMFVPYTVNFSISVPDNFEVILWMNEGNWVDTQIGTTEGFEIALVGEKLNFELMLPFDDFLPETVDVVYKLKAENDLAVRLRIPQQSTMFPIVSMLNKTANAAKLATPSTKGIYSTDSSAWFEFWRTEKFEVTFSHKYYAMPSNFSSDLPSHALRELFENLPSHPRDLSPDTLDVVVEVDGSMVLVTGMLVKIIVALKNNYFGLHDQLTDVDNQEKEPKINGLFGNVNKVLEYYRPIDVTLIVRVHNVVAHALTHMPTPNESNCPTVYVEQLVVEMDKNLQRTLVQVGMSTCVAHFSKGAGADHEGFAEMGGLQFRGHALFSSEEVPVDMAVNEYAWLMELIVGQISGRVRPAHLVQLAQFLDSFLLVMKSPDDDLRLPDRFNICQHGMHPERCPLKGSLKQCFSEDVLKYKHFRFALDGIRLDVVDHRAMFSLDASPVRVAFCNLHDGRFADTLTLKLSSIQARQLIQADPNSAKWIECARVVLDETHFTVTLPQPYDRAQLNAERLEFLRKHDRNDRLKFTSWDYSKPGRTALKTKGCACTGKAPFFADIDTVGEAFLMDYKELLAVRELKPSGQQPGFHQSILSEDDSIFLRSRRQAYAKHFVKIDLSKDSVLIDFKSEKGSTPSFYSATSAKTDGLRSKLVLDSPEIMKFYMTYADMYEIEQTHVEIPQLGVFGVLDDFKLSKSMQTKLLHTGIGDLKLESARTDTRHTENVEHTQESRDEENRAAMASTDLDRCSSVIEVTGSLAERAEIFLTPIGIEAFDSIARTITKTIVNLHPIYIAQALYRNCVNAAHRQPLTASLFPESSLPISVLVHCEVPTIYMSMFSASHSDLAQQVSSNLLLVRMDAGKIETRIATQNQCDPSLRVTFKRRGELAAQLLHLLDSRVVDFPTSRSKNIHNIAKWSAYPLAKELDNIDLRPIVDLCAPQLEIVLDLPGGANTQTFSTEPSADQRKLTFCLGTVEATIVMARPLDMTARHEFPLYDVVCPALSAWMVAGAKLNKTIQRAFESYSMSCDLKLIELLASALEDADALRVPKSRMGSVKKLYANLCSCPSCIVIIALLRHSTTREEKRHDSSIDLGALKEEDTRKASITALLSHWQTVVCKHVKLASDKEALKYTMRATNDEAVLPQPQVSIEPQNDSSSTVREKNDAVAIDIEPNATDAASSGDPHPGGPAPRPKLDLYQDILRANRKQKRDGGKRVEPEYADKSEVNAMELSLLAFFFPLHKYCKLEYSFLDGLPLGILHLNINVQLGTALCNVVEHKSVFTSDKKKLMLHTAHPLIELKKLEFFASAGYKMEMDPAGLRPVGIQLEAAYKVGVDSISSSVGISSVCVIKELTLVGITMSELFAELNNVLESTASTPLHDKRILFPNLQRSFSTTSITSNTQPDAVKISWVSGVLDMTQAYQKTNQRRGTTTNRDSMQLYISGDVLLSTLRLMGMLTDLCVSVTLHDISCKHTDRRHDTKHPNDHSNTIAIALRRATLAILESEVRPHIRATQTASTSWTPPGSYKKGQQHHILNCALSESKVTIARQAEDSGIVETTVRVALGTLESDLPMSAYSLHDAVLKHGAQLEQQFNRLSAQPPAPNTQTVSTPGGLLLSMDGTPRETTGVIPNARNVNLLGPPQRIVKVTFNFEISGIELSSQLLPSLRMRYIVGRIKSQGTTGDASKWTAELGKHEVRFVVVADGAAPENFVLPLPKVGVTGEYHIVPQDGAPVSAKQLHYREGGYLDVRVALGRVDYKFTTDLLNQILFAEQSFRSELSVLISRLRSSKPMPFAPGPSLVDPATPVTKPLLFSLKIDGLEEQGIPWLQLTASTPTSTAVRLTMDNMRATLTNRWVVREAEGRERIFGAAEIQLAAKLGQMNKPALFHEVAYELEEYASFMTQIRVENKEGTAQSNYSYLIALNRPIILIKSMALDKAVLLWLNYKNTYDYWRTERSKVEHERMRDRGASMSAPADSLDDLTKDRGARGSIPLFSPQPLGAATDININMSLSIQNGMYICMPLVGPESDGMSALIVSLEKSDVTVCVRKELACQASFESFKIAFVDNFDEQSLSDTFFKNSDETNYVFFPSGTYQFCSQASNPHEGIAEWVLSVRSQMQGMRIDLDHRIGGLTKSLINTLSSFGDNDYVDDECSRNSKVDIGEEDVKAIDDSAELRKIQAPDAKLRWIERKMHEESMNVSELQTNKAPEEQLEAARSKLHRLELIRFKQFRRSMIEKWKRNRQTTGKRQPNELLSMTAPAVMSFSKPPSLLESDNNTSGLATEIDTANNPNLQDTAVNMHIDLQVNISSGSCILRTPPKDVEQNQKSQAGSNLSTKPSAKDLRKGFPVLTTKFSIPSVDIKGYYVSAADRNKINVKSEDAKFHQVASAGGLFRPAALNTLERKVSSGNTGKDAKRGCFYLTVALASMPTETLLTPHLVDFFEKILEPSSMAREAAAGGRTSPVGSVGSESQHSEDARKPTPIVAIDTSVLPLDVIVYLSVQSSTIRFEGHQHHSSATDCLLKLPCLTLVASTRRIEEVVPGSGGLSTVTHGGVDISVTLSAFSLAIFSPHQDQTNQRDALSVTLDHLSFVISRSKNSAQEPDNKVKFVLTANVGSASLNYDMRRLRELAAFPKPWYRAAIMRRVFFGDQSMKPQSPGSSRERNAASRQSPINTVRAITDSLEKAWSLTVQATVQWKELNVFAQMGNAMGNTTWKARNGVLRGDAKLNSELEREVYMLFRLQSSDLSAHGGAVSGSISVSQLRIAASHCKKLKTLPRNCASIELKSIACRIEWMSRPVIIASCQKPALVIADASSSTTNQNGECNRASVNLSIEGRWDDLQAAINRCTVDDIHKIVKKINLFFQDQLRNSRLALGMQPNPAKPAEPEPASTEPGIEQLASRFWQKTLDTLMDLQYNKKLVPLPKVLKGETIACGSVQFEAGSISLACMHGDMNTNSWALFHLKQPLILFTPEAWYDFFDDSSSQLAVQMRQKLIVRLGPDCPDAHSADRFACVCRVSLRTATAMRPNASVDAALDFVIGEPLAQLDNLTRVSQHEVLELFQFPAFEAVMSSSQSNPLLHQEPPDFKPVVKTQFVCNFHSSVAVLTDFSAQVSFLPELLKSYVAKQEDRTSPPSLHEEVPKRDIRLFECDLWKVEPNMRFIDRVKWNPPMLNDVLKKLKIFNHDKTIPKALQRGLLDPLDVAVAVLLNELLKVAAKGLS